MVLESRSHCHTACALFESRAHSFIVLCNRYNFCIGRISQYCRAAAHIEYQHSRLVDGRELRLNLCWFMEPINVCDVFTNIAYSGLASDRNNVNKSKLWSYEPAKKLKYITCCLEVASTRLFMGVFLTYLSFIQFIFWSKLMSLLLMWFVVFFVWCDSLLFYSYWFFFMFFHFHLRLVGPLVA